MNSTPSNSRLTGGDGRDKNRCRTVFCFQVGLSVNRTPVESTPLAHSVCLKCAGRAMSAAARKQVVVAQKARGAKWRAQRGKEDKPRRSDQLDRSPSLHPDGQVARHASTDPDVRN
jgi:hypothetical protein